MERLTRAALEKRVKGKVQDYPCKVVQFGEGISCVGLLTG